MADPESTAPETDVSSAPVADSAPSQAPETSSPDASGDTGQSKESLLDAVLKVVPATTEKDVLADSKDTAAPPDAAQPDSEDQADTETDDADDDDTPPETSAPTRRKINKLLKQRRELRSQVAALEGPAQIGSELENFAQTNNLTGNDLAHGLRIMAQLRAGDYESFYASVAPFVRTAQEYLGVVLPAQLQKQVQQGQMTETVAKGLARQWYDNQRVVAERQQLEEANRIQAVQNVQTDVRRAVSNFELRLSASDPDYKAKAPAVKRAAQAMLFENGGTIENVEQALAITKAAYDEVNRQMRSVIPRPQATRPPANGTGQTPSARAAPQSLMEAALQGLAQSRRAGG